MGNAYFRYLGIVIIMTSACRYCRFYQSEGRRGGMCNQLGVMVQSSWKSCSLATSPFESPWEKVSDIALLESSLALNSSESIPTQKETLVPIELLPIKPNRL
jgi:hypothetical protein